MKKTLITGLVIQLTFMTIFGDVEIIPFLVLLIAQAVIVWSWLLGGKRK